MENRRLAIALGIGLIGAFALLACVDRTELRALGAMNLILWAITAWMVGRRLKRAEDQEEVQRQRMASASRFAELGEMAAGMAHEINTPLGAITLSASQLPDFLPKEGEHREVLSEIVTDILSSAEKISRIVRGLKNLSRNSSKGADFVFCNLPDIVNESLALCEPNLRSRGVRLISGKLPQTLDAQCNPSQISQLLINLVNNARDAAAEATEKWVEVTLSATGDAVEIRVTDSGPGFSAEAREKMFQPFFTTKDVGQGTGMGLSMVQGIARAHKGEVFLDPKSERTALVVRLPRLQS